MKSRSFWSRPENPTPMKVTVRDVQILYEFLQFRFAQPRHIHAMLGGSHKGIQRRCQLLWENGFLVRPKSLRTSAALLQELVYALDTRGARLLKDNDIQIRPIKQLELRENEKSYHFLDHALSVTEFMTCLRKACRRAGIIVNWDGQFDRRRHRKKVEVDGIQEYLEPDAYFSLEIPGKGRMHYFLESDRSRKKSLDHMRRRYEKYFFLWRDPELRSDRPFRDFQVLTVAAQDPRDVDLLRRSAQTVGRECNFQKSFLFSHLEAFNLELPEPVLGSSWLYADEDQLVRLIP